MGRILLPQYKRYRDSVIAVAGGGGGPAPETVDVLTGLYDVWECDENGWGSGLGEIAPATPDLRWVANNSIPTIAGLLNGGAASGAIDATSTSGGFRAEGGNMSAADMRTLFSPSGSFAWLQWVYPTVNPGAASEDVMFNIGPHSGSVYGWGVLHMGDASAANTKARFQVCHSATYSARDIVTSDTALTLNAWNMVAVGRDAASGLIGVSINGESWKTAASTGAPLTASGDAPVLWAQGSGLGNKKWSGRQDQLAYWNAGFPNSVSLAALYNSGAGVLYADWGSL